MVLMRGMKGRRNKRKNRKRSRGLGSRSLGDLDEGKDQIKDHLQIEYLKLKRSRFSVTLGFLVKQLILKNQRPQESDHSILI